jgi:hypothetical protein
MRVSQMRRIFLGIANSMLIETAIPNRAPETNFLAGTEREPSFDKCIAFSSDTSGAGVISRCT